MEKVYQLTIFSNFMGMKHIVIFSVFFSLGLSSCQTNETEKMEKSSEEETIVDRSNKTGFLNSFYLSCFLEDIDIKYYPFLFIQSDVAVSQVNFYVKNGRLKNNISEKYTYLFSNHKLKSLSHFSQVTYHQPFTDFIFSYEADSISKMFITKYINTTNQPPYYYSTDSLYSLVVVPKGAEQFDSTYFYPSYESPRIIYTRSNNKTLDVQLFVPIGTTLKEIKTELEVRQELLKVDDFTYVFITYTDNNLPMETYEMASDLDFSYKVRSWEYNSNWLPTRYREYMTSSLIKDMSIEYDDNNFPNYIRLNKKAFHSYYKFDDAD